MRRNSYKKNLLFIIILIVIISGISLSYALLSKVLTTQFGNVTQSALVYNVKIDSGTVIQNSASDYNNCGSVVIDNNYTRFRVLGAQIFPATYCIYKIGIKHTGSGISAKLTSITPAYPEGLSNCSNASNSFFGCDVPNGRTGSRLQFQLSRTSAFSTSLTTGLTIAPGSTEYIYLRIKNGSSTLSNNAVVNGGGFSLVFTAT